MKYPNYICNAGALSAAIKCFAMQLRQYTQTKLATDLTFSEVLKYFMHCFIKPYCNNKNLGHLALPDSCDFYEYSFQNMSCIGHM